MSTKRRLKDRLQQINVLIADGCLNTARARLDELYADSNIHILGQPTALGIPRQIQSARLKLAKAEKDPVRSIGYQYHLVPPPELITACAQFTSTERKTIVQLSRQNIPRTIHQIWIGSRPLPVGVQAWSRHAQKHGYEHRLWREEDLNRHGFDQHPVFRAMQNKGDLPGAVDVARYLILQQAGGIYLDCDWYPAREDISFHDLLPMSGLTAIAEPIPRNTGKGALLLANSIIASPPHHPVFKRLIGVLEDVMHKLPDAPAWWVTGPLIFTLVSRGGALTLADAAIVAGALPQETSLEQVEVWCADSQQNDQGLLLSWKSWIW